MITARRALKYAAITLFFAIIATYAAFEFRGIAAGPSLIVEKPQPGDTITDSLFLVEGRAERVSFLYLNGSQIYTDENGFFKEPLVVPKGYNIVTVTAIGRFNRTVTTTIDIVAL